MMPENLEMLTRERQRPIAVSLLGDFIEESRARPKDFSNMAVHGISNTRGFVASEDLFSVSRASLDQSNYKVVSPKSFAYNPSRINVGSIALSSNQQDVLVSPMYTVFRTTKKLVPEYLAHFLRSSHFKAYMLSNIEVGARFRFTFDALANTPIQVPSIEVQLEIVRILDTFTELESELEAELEARKKQYDFYRKTLFNSAGENAKYEELGDVVLNLDSKRKPVTRSLRTPGPYPYFGANGIQDYVAGFLFDETLLLVGEDGSVIRPDGTPYVNWSEGKSWVNNHAHVLATKDASVSLRFIFHYLQTVQVAPYVTGGSQLKINQANLNKILVPIPPRRQQDEIVRILDLLHDLVSSLTEGLPGEITARRRQYEHYRDKLLTFKELVA
jgi:type I restriction enzyme, S subunit